MRNISFDSLRRASDAMRHEIERLEQMAAEHNELKSFRVASVFAKEAAQIERARAEIHAAMGGAPAVILGGAK